jgi:hypothetical protein
MTNRQWLQSLHDKNDPQRLTLYPENSGHIYCYHVIREYFTHQKTGCPVKIGSMAACVRCSQAWLKAEHDWDWDYKEKKHAKK